MKPSRLLTGTAALAAAMSLSVAPALASEYSTQVVPNDPATSSVQVETPTASNSNTDNWLNSLMGLVKDLPALFQGISGKSPAPTNTNPNTSCPGCDGNCGPGGCPANPGGNRTTVPRNNNTNVGCPNCGGNCGPGGCPANRGGNRTTTPTNGWGRTGNRGACPNCGGNCGPGGCPANRGGNCGPGGCPANNGVNNQYNRSYRGGYAGYNRGYAGYPRHYAGVNRGYGWGR